jgi:heat shock protein HslJ/membrane-bound inhibitor of C-type lysozyme
MRQPRLARRHTATTLLAGLVLAAPVTGALAQVPPGKAPAAPTPATPRVAALTCGTDQVTVVFQGAIARLTLGTQTWEMAQVRVASGAKYEVEGDPGTSFWSKGQGGTLTVKGKAYPECAPLRRAPGAAGARPFTAGGNEPGWNLTIAAGNALTLLTDMGATTTRVAKASVEAVPNGRKYSGSGGGKPVVATVLDAPCVDTMTGMPRPNTVEVTLDGTTYKGCGGDPATLLRGTSWIVAELNGAPIVERSRVTMEFGTDGRVTGASSCNTYGAKYTLTPESLTVGPAMATRRACSPAFMTQETTFLKVLAAVRTFEVRGDGSLLFKAGDGSGSIGTRPPAPPPVK